MKRYLTGKHFTAFRMIIKKSWKRDSRLISAAESYLVISVWMCTFTVSSTILNSLIVFLQSSTHIPALAPFCVLVRSLYQWYFRISHWRNPMWCPQSLSYPIHGCKTTTLHRQFRGSVMIKIINYKIKCCQTKY